jgi:hypothetical protein
MTDGGYEDEFDDTSIFENKSGLAEVKFYHIILCTSTSKLSINYWQFVVHYLLFTVIVGGMKIYFTSCMLLFYFVICLLN